MDRVLDRGHHSHGYHRRPRFSRHDLLSYHRILGRGKRSERGAKRALIVGFDVQHYLVRSKLFLVRIKGLFISMFLSKVVLLTLWK